mgnify:CR=1 FL=1
MEKMEDYKFIHFPCVGVFRKFWLLRFALYHSFQSRSMYSGLNKSPGTKGCGRACVVRIYIFCGNRDAEFASLRNSKGVVINGEV